MIENTFKNKKALFTIGAAALSLVVGLDITLGANADKAFAGTDILSPLTPEHVVEYSQNFAIKEENASKFIDVISDENGVSYIVPNSFRYSTDGATNINNFDFATSYSSDNGTFVSSTRFTFVTSDTDENGVVTYAPRNAEVDDIEYFNCGYQVNVGDKGFSLFLRSFGGNSSIDVLYNNGRYRLMSDNVNELVTEFERTGELKVELAQTPVDLDNGNKFNYYFKFTSGESNVSYGNMPYATVYNLTGNTEWFLCAESGSLSGETKITTSDLLKDLAVFRLNATGSGYYKIFSTVSRSYKEDFNLTAENDKYLMKVETNKNFDEFLSAYDELYSAEHPAEEPAANIKTDDSAIKAWFEKLGNGINNLFGFNVANKYSAIIGVVAVALVAFLIFRRKRR